MADETDAEVEVDFGGPFTLDEIARIEELTDLPFSRWFDGKSPEGTLRKVIAWTYACRANPDSDLDAFGQLTLKVG